MKKILWMLPLLAAIPLLAVTPQFWEIRTNDDFRKGKLTNLSLTSDDELILAPRFDMVFNTEQPLVWSAVADSKGNVYIPPLGVQIVQNDGMIARNNWCCGIRGIPKGPRQARKKHKTSRKFTYHSMQRGVLL